jgi:phage terminase large subunit-like protein
LPHPHIAPWVRLFVEELTKFPRFGSDDQVDGLTQFINWWREENANKQDDKTFTVPGQVHDTGDMFT